MGDAIYRRGHRFVRLYISVERFIYVVGPNVVQDRICSLSCGITEVFGSSHPGPEIDFHVISCYQAFASETGLFSGHTAIRGSGLGASCGSYRFKACCLPDGDKFRSIGLPFDPTVNMYVFVM